MIVGSGRATGRASRHGDHPWLARHRGRRRAWRARCPRSAPTWSSVPKISAHLVGSGPDSLHPRRHRGHCASRGDDRSRAPSGTRPPDSHPSRRPPAMDSATRIDSSRPPRRCAPGTSRRPRRSPRLPRARCVHRARRAERAREPPGARPTPGQAGTGHSGPRPCRVPLQRSRSIYIRRGGSPAIGSVTMIAAIRTPAPSPGPWCADDGDQRSARGAPSPDQAQGPQPDALRPPGVLCAVLNAVSARETRPRPDHRSPVVSVQVAGQRRPVLAVTLRVRASPLPSQEHRVSPPSPPHGCDLLAHGDPRLARDTRGSHPNR
jgi:hypothetical protein